MLHSCEPNAFYTTSTHREKSHSFDYIKVFIRTHAYFPVTTHLWNGKDYSSTPCQAHRTIFDFSERRHVIAQHPHGPVALGGGMLLPQLTPWGWDFFSRLRVGTASAVMMAPFVKDFHALFGCIDASRSVLDRAMATGHSILLLPGGIKEQLMVPKPGKEPIVLRKRRGFIRLALSHGAMLTPSLAFGERRLYNYSPFMAKISTQLKKWFNAGIPAITGRLYSLTPFARPMNIVLAKPIDTVVWLQQYRMKQAAAKPASGDNDTSSHAESNGSMVQRPAAGAVKANAADHTPSLPLGSSVCVTDEEVQALLDEYIVLIKNLFDDLKGRFGSEDLELEIL